MLAKLKPMEEILRHSSVELVNRNSHYWKFYYKDKQALGFRDFYLKYWKGERLVEIKPKRDRKKVIIPDKYEIYGKRGNYVFTAYEYWFEWIGPKSSYLRSVENPEPKPTARDIARKRSLVNLSWNDF